MNRNLLIIVVIIVSLLSGCVEEKSTETIKQTKTENDSKESDNIKGYEIKNATLVQFKVAEQEFEIVPVFEPHLEYVQKLRENPDANHSELYISTVIEPFRKEAYSEDRGLWLKDMLTGAINIEKLNESIILLDENYEHISNLIKESIEKSAKLLPSGKKTIYLFPFNPDQSLSISTMNGVAGFATEQLIVLQIAPQKYKEELIPYTMAHEYYHTVYFEKYKTQQRDLIDYVLSEGRADSFANLIYPNMNIPWIAEVPQEDVKTIWN
ncbi:IS1595 family transposase ISSpps1 [Pseudoneobacillus rhizosphaerae]|uniref:IS1595 family transposase ISSpps1 n=1 Tax=Pseudoneobacillus rhizosphaerae TaxID=2880968 RepID=A0A9C7LCW1_9BACI|nr:IS1595 family transposase ISSpps1 [Pseudoneobacillus rhizosphaerae]